MIKMSLALGRGVFQKPTEILLVEDGRPRWTCARVIRRQVTNPHHEQFNPNSITRSTV